MILITYDFEVSFFLNPRLTKNHILEQKRISIYTAYAFIFINTIAGCKYDNTKVGFYISNLINVKSKALGRWLIYGVLIKNKLKPIFGIHSINYKKKYKIGFGRLTWYWIFRIINQKKLFLLSKEFSNIQIKNRFLEYELALKNYEIGYSMLQKNINKVVSFSKKYLNDFEKRKSKSIKIYAKKTHDFVFFNLKHWSFRTDNLLPKIIKRIRKVKFANKRGIRKKKRLSKRAEIFFLKKKVKEYSKFDKTSKIYKREGFDHFLAKTVFKLNILKKKVKKTLWDLKMAKVLYFGKLSAVSNRISNLKNITGYKTVNQKKNYFKKSIHKNKYLVFQYLFPKNTIELKKSTEFVAAHDNFKNSTTTPTYFNYKRSDVFIKDKYFNNKYFFCKYKKIKQNTAKIKKNKLNSGSFFFLKSKKLLKNKPLSVKKNKLMVGGEVSSIKLSKTKNISKTKSKTNVELKNTFVSNIKNFKNNWLGSGVIHKINKNINKIKLTYFRFYLNLEKFDHLVFNILNNSLFLTDSFKITDSIAKSTVYKYKIFAMNSVLAHNSKKFRFRSQLKNKYSFILLYKDIAKSSYKVKLFWDKMKKGWNTKTIKKTAPRKNKKYFETKILKVKIRLKKKRQKVKLMIKKIKLKNELKIFFKSKKKSYKSSVFFKKKNKIKFYNRNTRILLFAKTLKPKKVKLTNFIFKKKIKKYEMGHWTFKNIFGRLYKGFWWKKRPNNFFKKYKVIKKLKAALVQGKLTNNIIFLNTFYLRFKKLKEYKISKSTSNRFLFLKNIVNYNFKKFTVIKINNSLEQITKQKKIKYLKFNILKKKNIKINILKKKLKLSNKLFKKFKNLNKLKSLSFEIDKLKLKKLKKLVIFHNFKFLKTKKKALKYALSRRIFTKLNHIKKLKKIKKKFKINKKKRFWNLTKKIKNLSIFTFKKKKKKIIKKIKFWKRFTKKNKSRLKKIKKIKLKKISKTKNSYKTKISQIHQLLKNNSKLLKKDSFLFKLKVSKTIGIFNFKTYSKLHKLNFLTSKQLVGVILNKKLIKLHKLFLFSKLVVSSKKFKYKSNVDAMRKITFAKISKLHNLNTFLEKNKINTFNFNLSNCNKINNLLKVKPKRLLKNNKTSILFRLNIDGRFIFNTFGFRRIKLKKIKLKKIKINNIRFKKAITFYKKKHRIRHRKFNLKKKKKYRRSQFFFKKKRLFRKITKFSKYFNLLTSSLYFTKKQQVGIPSFFIKYKNLRNGLVVNANNNINCKLKGKKFFFLKKKSRKLLILLKKINKVNRKNCNNFLNKKLNKVIIIYPSYSYKFSNKAMLGISNLIRRKYNNFKKNKKVLKIKKIRSVKNRLRAKRMLNSVNYFFKFKKKSKLKNKYTKKIYKIYTIHKNPIYFKSSILFKKLSKNYINLTNSDIFLTLNNYLHFFNKNNNTVRKIKNNNIQNINNFNSYGFFNKTSKFFNFNKKIKIITNRCIKNNNYSEYISFFNNDNKNYFLIKNCNIILNEKTKKNYKLLNLSNKKYTNFFLNNLLMVTAGVIFKKKIKTTKYLLSLVLKNKNKQNSNIVINYANLKKYLNFIQLKLKNIKSKKNNLNVKKLKKLNIFINNKNKKNKVNFYGYRFKKKKLRKFRNIRRRRFVAKVSYKKKINVPYSFIFQNRFNVSKKNNNFFKRFLKLKQKFIIFGEHMIPVNIDDRFIFKNFFLNNNKYYKKTRLHIKERILNMYKHHTLILSSNVKTKNKRIKQLKHNFFRRPQNKKIIIKFRRLRNIRKYLKKRIMRLVKYSLMKNRLKRWKFKMPRPKKFWIGNYRKAKKMEVVLKKKTYNNFLNFVKFKDFGFKKLKFWGARYTKFIVRLRRIKNIRASGHSKFSAELDNLMIAKYWRKLRKSTMYLLKKKKRSFSFKNEPKWVFFKRKFYNWRFNFRYARPRYLQFGKRFLPKYWYKIIRRKFPLKRKKKEWSVKIPKVYTLLYFKKRKRLTFFDSSSVYFRYMSTGAGMKRYKKLKQFTNKIYTQEGESWLYECDISPSFLRFAGLRSVRKRSKEAKKSFSEVLLKKRFSKLFYPSLVLSVSNHKSAAKANVGFRKTVNMLGRTSSVFFKNKYKVVRLFFNKLRKNLRIASDFDTLIVKNTIEQSVSKFFFSDFINTADTFSSNYNQMNNNVSILGHIHNCNKDKLINNIIKIEHSLYTIINYKYDGFFNLNTITSNKKYNSLKLYNFKLKQLIHSKYNDLGFFFKKNLNINIENNKVYENFFKLVKREEVSLNCRLHQFKFLTNNRNKSVRYKQISPIFLNKVPQYFKKNMHIFRSVSITKGLSIDSANNFNVSF